MSFSVRDGDEIRPSFPAPDSQGEDSEDNDRDYGLDASHRIPFILNRHLRRYQRQGIKFMFRRCFGGGSLEGGAILGDDMGLGKTVQVIGLFSALLGKTHRAEEDLPAIRRARYSPEGSVGLFLVVCPASVMKNWEQELDAWGYFAVGRLYKTERRETLQLARLGRLEVVLTTFETARESVEEINSVRWDCVVVDEVHRIKEPRSKVTNAVKSIRCRRRIGLTGTLLQNRSVFKGPKSGYVCYVAILRHPREESGA